MIRTNFSTKRNRTVSNYPKGVLMITLLVFMLLSCDIGDFGDMNVNPTQIPEVNPGMHFTSVQLGYAGARELRWRQSWWHSAAVIQQATRPGSGSPYNTYSRNRDTSSWYFQYAYPGQVGWDSQVKAITDIITQLRQMDEDGEEVVNLIAASRIMRVLIFQTLTDLYGDIPYFEAGKGAIEGIYAPAYDPQSVIYEDLFNELDEAVQQFNPAQPTYGSAAYGNADLLYGGDIEQWQKFGNSLRLRLALRLVKRDIDEARNQAEAAIAAPGGVMSSNDDIAFVRRINQEGTTCCDPFGNGDFYVMQAQIFWITQTLIDWLKDHNDPRLSIFAAHMNRDNDVLSTDPDDLIGLPSGWTTGELEAEHPSWALAEALSPDDDVTNGYAKINPIMWPLDGPSLYQTYAEVALMRAEVAARGWNAGGNAEDFYNDGVRAALEHLSLYGDGGEISSSAIDDYLAENPFDAGNAIEQINEQYWVATFMNFNEGWANFRRSGYPDLELARVDSPEPPTENDTGGQWPRRMLYHVSEENLNSANLNEAVSRQGMSNTIDMVTPVWWDVD